ncbi:hypothetical protein PR003_g4407, partial [Phytophthora rubi]
MVRVLSPPRPTYSNAQIAGFYFRPCHNGNDEVIPEYFRCRCGTVRKQTHRNGYSNLMQHVRREHSDYEAVMLDASTAETGSLINFVRHSALNFYSNLQPISQETLRAGMDGVMVAIERKIAAELPARFGIMLDGWTHASEHYLAVFACYEVNTRQKTTLLCMAPLLEAEDDDLTARGH